MPLFDDIIKKVDALVVVCMVAGVLIGIPLCFLIGSLWPLILFAPVALYMIGMLIALAVVIVMDAFDL